MTASPSEHLYSVDGHVRAPARAPITPGRGGARSRPRRTKSCGTLSHDDFTTKQRHPVHDRLIAKVLNHERRRGRRGADFPKYPVPRVCRRKSRVILEIDADALGRPASSPSIIVDEISCARTGAPRVSARGQAASLRPRRAIFSRHSDGVCWPALLRARVLAFSNVLTMVRPQQAGFAPSALPACKTLGTPLSVAASIAASIERCASRRDGRSTAYSTAHTGNCTLRTANNHTTHAPPSLD